MASAVGQGHGRVTQSSTNSAAARNPAASSRTWSPRAAALWRSCSRCRTFGSPHLTRPPLPPAGSRLTWFIAHVCVCKGCLCLLCGATHQSYMHHHIQRYSQLTRFKHYLMKMQPVQQPQCASTLQINDKSQKKVQEGNLRTEFSRSSNHHQTCLVGHVGLTRQVAART